MSASEYSTAKSKTNYGDFRLASSIANAGGLSGSIDSQFVMAAGGRAPLTIDLQSLGIKRLESNAAAGRENKERSGARVSDLDGS